MKYVAWVLVIVLLAVVGGGVYLYLNANVAIEEIVFTSVSASERETEFQDYQRRLLNGAVPGTVFSADALSDNAGDYAFYTYTVKLKNNCFIPAKMVEVQVVPVAGDVLQTLDETDHTLPPREAGAVRATVLTHATSHSVRQVIVTYYLWGYMFTTTKTYG